MSTIRVSVSYRSMSPNDIGDFATKVVTNLNDHVMQFPMLPVPEPTFTAIVNEYIARRGQYKNGGTNQKGAYLQAKTVLIDTLDQTAVYVDSVAQGDEAIILNSGFVPTKGSRTPSPKPIAAEGVTLTNKGIQILEAQCNPQQAISTYLCILTEGAPLPEGIHITTSGQIDLGLNKVDTPEERAAIMVAMGQITNAWMDLTKGRIKMFAGLTTGKRYYVTICAINPTGVGPLSTAVSTICL